eukprot:TRINITY_DN1195_c0_g6_i1.p1 TRINITY_DN1195_c0_g6~~TRINITY_DN1195_c0_g6_i1.p1  ORF type:complete len:411 (-),score=57.27 TRINITY_DN1195_c0_g6_i1:232-1305(-)
MTFQSTTTTTDIANMITTCLYNPGTFICKLYRSDGITQNSTISQLFANYYRAVPYEYYTSTPYENSLRNIEEHFAANRSEFATHIQREHAESIEEITAHENCGNNCIAKVLSTISACIQEYASAARLSMEEEGDEEVVERVLEEYGTYTAFIVVAEAKLLSLSSVIGEIQSEKYPNSLWKFLYGKFWEYLCGPLEERLREILAREIKKLRANAIERAINRKTDFFNFSAFDTVSKLRELSFLLSGRDLNEATVYFTESTVYPYNPILDQTLKAQTAELYQNFTISKTLLRADLKVLQDILMPSQVTKLIAHCTAVAKERGDLNEFQEQSVLEQYEYKDAEIEMCARRLGLVECSRRR